jgi:hypothetical protein
MALYLLQPGLQPLGQFDFLDTDLPNVLGGDIGTWDEASRTITAAEKAAQDVLDGYVADLVDAGTPDASRPVLRLADDGTGDRASAFYLLDDGTANYGTSFGTLIGNPVGLSTTTASGGIALGVHTAQASGKVTAWDKPGLYAVSTDALDADVLGGANLNDTPLPGETLYRGDSTGQLTRVAGANNVVALFVELSGNGSLVTTPGRLVGAAEAFDRIVINYVGASHNVS